MKFLTHLLLTFLLATQPAFGQTASNKLRWGDRTDSDKTLEADLGNGATNPKIQYNTTDDEWTFSNDGTAFVTLGS